VPGKYSIFNVNHENERWYINLRRKLLVWRFRILVGHESVPQRQFMPA